MFRRLVGRLGLGLHWHLARGGRVVLHLCTVAAYLTSNRRPSASVSTPATEGR